MKRNSDENDDDGIQVFAYSDIIPANPAVGKRPRRRRRRKNNDDGIQELHNFNTMFQSKVYDATHLLCA